MPVTLHRGSSGTIVEVWISPANGAFAISVSCSSIHVLCWRGHRRSGDAGIR